MSRLFGDVAGVQVGQLRLVRYLGQGAAGLVYEAVDPERGAVAVKFLNRVDAGGVYRVKREFRSLAGLQHPNLVSLHELVHDRDHWFFSMELVDGVPIDQWVRSAVGALDEDRLRDALRQLASGVSAIHAAGKLHCDLKPSNVVITRDGVVKVLDFGLVRDRVEDPSGSDTGLAGTPAYIAPEQAAGQPAVPASDWYAVGVMLHGILAGRLPFEGSALAVLRAKQLRDAPELPVPEAAAEALYTLCARLLIRDPSLRAGAAQVFEALDHGADRVAARSIAPAPIAPSLFVGRESELEALRAGLRAAATGDSSVVLIRGPSGIGKSALLDRFAAELDRDVLLLRGRCYEQESLPYKVFEAVIDALGRYLCTLAPDRAQRHVPRHLAALLRLFPVLGRVEGFAAPATPALADESGAIRLRAFAAAKELLLRLTDYHRVVIMVDDLQWGDLDSVRMMTHVFGPPEAPPLMFVGAYRSDEVHDGGFVATLLEERLQGHPWRLRQLTLDPLPLDAATEVAHRRLDPDGVSNQPDVVADMALRVAREAGGMPFLIDELADNIVARRAASASDPGPVSLERAVLDRVQALPEPCRELLDVVVVAGAPIEVKVALAAAGLLHGDRSHLHALRNARLVRGFSGPPSDAVEVYHDRIRQLLAACMTSERHRALHGQVASAMLQHGVHDAERLLVHHLGAGDRERALAAALDAAHAAAGKLAFNRAAELSGRALELLADGDARQRELRVLFADALANAGRGGPASEQYMLAARDLEPHAVRELQLKAAQQCFRSGLLTRGFELAAPLLKRYGISLDGSRPTLIARLLWQRFCYQLQRWIRPSQTADAEISERAATLGGLFQELMISEPLRGAIVHAAFLRRALRQPDPLPRLRALVWESVHATWLGGRSGDRRANELLVAVAELSRQIGTPYARAFESLGVAFNSLHSGRYAQAMEHARTATALFEESPGAYWERAQALLLQCGAAELVGDLRVVAVIASPLARAAAEREDDAALTYVSFSVALVSLAHDEPEAAMNLLESRLAKLEGDFGVLHYLAVHRITDCLIYMGRSQEALAHLQRSWKRLTAMDNFRSSYLQTGVHMVRARARLAVYGAARDRSLVPGIHADLRRVDAQPQHRFGGMSDVLRGTLLELDGDRQGAIALVEKGVAQLERDGLDRFLQPALRRLGELVAGPRGAELIARADAALQRQGVQRPALFANMFVTELGRGKR